MKLTHDVPQSQGAANALKRAKQMVNIAYTPCKAMPIVTKVFDENVQPSMVRSFSIPGFPLQGIVYSSVRRVEKFVGYNVSPETFVTAVANPNSVIYNKLIIQEGRVTVNGETCTMRGKKMRPGDRCSIDNELELVVV